MRTNQGRRLGAALAMTAALVLGGVSVAFPSAPTASAAGPCGPLGTLVVFELNDRCDFGTGLDPMNVGDKAVVTALQKAGLFGTRITCRNKRIVPIVAVPDQLLLTGENAERLAVAVQTTRRRLDNQVVGEPRPINALATRLALRPGTLTPSFLRNVIPTLQGQGFSVDLNYFEPAMPKNGFNPGDNPAEGQEQRALKGGSEKSVLVVDSPAQSQTMVFDLDGNGFIDEDNGHGDFVAELVKLLAPQADVQLAGVRGRQIASLARWSPMMFSDADVIRAMGNAFGLSPGGTAVRRSFNAVNLSLGGSGCDGIAARLPLGRFMRGLALLATKLTDVAPTYVAAAGNDGGDVKHFPAAWRDRPTILAAADAVDLAIGGGSPTVAGNQIRQIQAFLERQMIAVGSWTAGVRDSFSNCGDWVNGFAAGSDAVSMYPSKTGWASWSGTSFATPRVTAMIVGGTNPGDIDTGPAIGAC
jgi:hypothetical protein